MAKTRRDKLKRKLAQAYRNCDNALMDLRVIHETFKDVHPELAEGLEVAIGLNIQSQEIMLAFAQYCWLLDKERLMSYI